MIGEITKGYIDWIMIGVIQKDGIEIIRIIQLIINLNNTIINNNTIIIINSNQKNHIGIINLKTPIASQIIQRSTKV